MSEYIGRRIIPVHGGVWNGNKSYEELTIVLEEDSGDSYISRRAVPAGTTITDENYWMLHSLYSQQIADAVSQMEETGSRMDTLEKRLDANVTASTDADADYAAEVVDARVDELGNTYSALGSAVRGIAARSVRGTGEMVTSQDGAEEQFGADFDGMGNNLVYCIGLSGLELENAPCEGFSGVVLCAAYSASGKNGKIQIAIGADGTAYYRICWQTSNTWTGWITTDTTLSESGRAADAAAVGDALAAVEDTLSLAVRGYGSMVTSQEKAEEQFGADFDGMANGMVYCIGLSGLEISHPPYEGFLGVVLCAGYNATGKNGKVQVAFGSTGRVLHRICWKSTNTWTDWAESTQYEEEQVYYIGGDSKNQSISELFLSLADDWSEKTIYINPGTYDIYQEYRDLEMESPPDDVTSSDYLDRCIFVPPNTHLIGIGNVMLEWNPELEDITYGEARTWSPLNVRYACKVENISIYTKYGRYCIHDDSHNASEDRGVKHIYRNVRCTKEYVSNGYGFNDTVGFGFSQMNTYLFEDCCFKMDTYGNAPAFYGHGASGSSLLEAESPNITVRNCVILGGESNDRTIRLQCLNDVALDIRTVFEGCYIEGGLYITLYDQETDVHAYRVTLLRSGNPAQTIEAEDDNPYPVEVYE